MEKEMATRWYKSTPLCGFDRVSIAAGTTKEVKLYINKRDLSYWDEQRQSFVEAPGKKLLLIGASSEDIRTKIEL